MSFIEATSAVQSCWFVKGVGCYEILKDFLPTIISAAAIIVSVKIAFSQWKRQHQSSSKLQLEETRQATKIEVFKDFSEKISESQRKISELHTRLMCHKHMNIKNEKYSFEQFVNDFQLFSEECNSITISLEKYAIVQPQFFRVTRYAFYELIYKINIIARNHVTEETVSELIYITSEFKNYIHDLQVSLQNLTYGSAFGHSLEPRKPLDASVIVITNDKNKLDDLEHYFKNKSVWGKATIETLEVVAAKLKEKAK